MSEEKYKQGGGIVWVSKINHHGMEHYVGRIFIRPTFVCDIGADIQTEHFGKSEEAGERINEIAEFLNLGARYDPDREEAPGPHEPPRPFGHREAG